MEKAKLNLMIAYAADSLFYMFLKTQVSPRPFCTVPRRLHVVPLICRTRVPSLLLVGCRLDALTFPS